MYEGRPGVSSSAVTPVAPVAALPLVAAPGQNRLASPTRTQALSVSRRNASASDAGPAVFHVDSSADGGDETIDGVCAVPASGGARCTLRAALQEANATTATDTVMIDVALVQPVLALPPIIRPAVVDGRGTARLDGGRTAAGVGLDVRTGRSAIRGLSVTGWRDIGLSLRGPEGDSTITGCRVGVDQDGTAVPNGHGADSVSSGIAVFDSPGNLIGGPGSDGNLVSGNNGTGIRIFGSAAIGNRVQGNLVGLGSDGRTAVPNTGDGVMVGQLQGATGEGATGTVIGGASEVGNTIAGNGRTGVVVARAAATSVTHNRIGLAADDAAEPVPNGDSGLEVHMAPATGVRGNTISGNTGYGVLAAGGSTTDLVITGNRVGTDPAGRLARPNSEHGVAMGPAADDHKSPPGPEIGGRGDEGNVVSANGGWGILADGSAKAKVRGNMVGVGVNGTGQLGNKGPGIGLIDTTDGLIGGSDPGTGNTIGNNQWGVILQDTAAQESPPSAARSLGNSVQGNRIGVADDRTSVPNQLDGVQIDGSGRTTVGYPLKGDPKELCVAPCNLIAGNGRSGVNIQRSTATGNTVRGNAIWLNKGLGIAFTEVADPPSVIRVPPNDADDRDSGPNGRLNFPTGVLKVTQPGNPGYKVAWRSRSSEVTGFTSPPVQGQLIDMYALVSDDDKDPWPPQAHSNFGEGRAWIGSVVTKSDGTFSLPLTASKAAAYERFTATATDQRTGATSTFSAVCAPTTADSADHDGDGLCDQREANGIDDNGDGHIDLDLAGRLADAGHRDLFLEVDQYPGMAPHLWALRKVRDAFGKAPVDNPDGTTGIRLHIYPGLPPAQGTLEPQTDTTLAAVDAPRLIDLKGFEHIKDGSADRLCDGAFGTAADRMAIWDGRSNCAHVLGARRQVYRYALFADRQADDLESSGVAETPGDDLIVSLGAFLSGGSANRAGVSDELATSGGFGSECHDRETCLTEIQAAVLMHELGHTLGLLHGGGDGINNKPNYLSVMNYILQWRYPVVGRPLDYSHVALATINERALDETKPLAAGHPAADMRGWTHSAFYAPTANRSGTCRPVAVGLWGSPDWIYNGNPGETDLADRQVTSKEKCSQPGGSALEGWNDWNHLIMTSRLRGWELFAGAPPSTGVPQNQATDITATQIVEWARTSDRDGDGVADTTDLCPDIADPDQTDRDLDGYGDACLPLRTTRDLAIAAEAQPTAATVGTPVTLTVTLSNHSPLPATDIVTSIGRQPFDDDPEAAAPVRTSHGTYDATTAQWTVPVLPPRAEAVLYIKAVAARSPYIMDAQIITSGEPDDDSLAGNHLPGEDDQLRLVVDPPLPAAASRYTPLLVAEEGMWPAAMSANGVIVGTGPTPSHPQRALLWPPGSSEPTDLGALSGEQSSATAISPNGRIAAGTSTEADGAVHVVTFTEGQVNKLRRLCTGCDEIQVTGVNDQGYVTTVEHEAGPWYNPIGSVTGPDGAHTLLQGQYAWPRGIGDDGTAFGSRSGCLYEPTTRCGTIAVSWPPEAGGRSETIGMLEGGNDASAEGRNASGTVVGTGILPAPPPRSLPWRAFTWNEGTFSVLPLPEGASESYATAINRQGVVVGRVEGRLQSAVVSVDGALVDLNTLLLGFHPYVLTDALGISDDGRILVRARSRNATSPDRTLVLMPTDRAPGR